MSIERSATTRSANSGLASFLLQASGKGSTAVPTSQNVPTSMVAESFEASQTFWAGASVAISVVSSTTGGLEVVADLVSRVVRGRW